MDPKNKKVLVFLLMPALIAACFPLSGCVRLKTAAGYSYQSPEDEAPKSRQVGFDTQNLLPQKAATPGTIEING